MNNIADVLDATADIGSFNYCNGAFAKLLKTRLDESGMLFEDLSIKEARELLKKTSTEFNKRADELMA
jgi:hypothetical protein